MQNALCSTHAHRSYTHTHTPAHTVKANQKFPLLSPPHISSPLLSTVTYHPATSAARHLLSGSVWKPFNPPSKEVFPVNGGKRDPNTKGRGGRGGGGGGIRGEGLAERATQLVLHAGVGLQPSFLLFFFRSESFGNILHIDIEVGQNTALSWRVVGLWVTGQRSESYGRCGKECRKPAEYKGRTTSKYTLKIHV